MSSEHKPPDDRELDDFLAGRHPVARAYREGSQNDAAPPELDAAILAAAREAVRAPVARRPRWVQPVALAATLVLGLSVLMNMWRDPQLREQAVPAAASVPEPMRERTPIEMHSAPSGAAEAAAPEPAQAEPSEKKKAAQEQAKPEAPPAASAAAPPPPPAPSAMPERDERSPVLHDRSGSYASQAPAAARPFADADASVAPAEAEAAPSAEMRQRSFEKSLSRPAYKLAPNFESRTAPAPSQDVSQALGAAAGVPSPASADYWIARVRDELARGDQGAARASLVEFRRAYPDAILPDDLASFEAATK